MKLRSLFPIRHPSQGAQQARSERGVALIIVMISIFVLTMLAGAFALSMKVETRLARNANNEAEVEWLGRSAIECARWELAEQLRIPQEPYDALNQVWAGGSGSMTSTNSPLMDFKNEIHTENGASATWTIIDCERKANINSANQDLLNQAFTIMGVDAGATTPLVNAILDWTDTDDNTRVQGAESEYYQNLTPPYYAKNGPIDDISELLLIKGITPDIFWGSGSSNYIPGAFTPEASRNTGMNANNPMFAVGLTNLFTPLSGGWVNINTASVEVLQLVPGITPEFAEAIVSARGGEDDGTGLFGPFRASDPNYIYTRVPGIPLPLARQISNFVRIRSQTFEVHVDAQANGYHRHFVGVLGRANPRDIQILSFYWTD